MSNKGSTDQNRIMAPGGYGYSRETDLKSTIAIDLEKALKIGGVLVDRIEIERINAEKIRGLSLYDILQMKSEAISSVLARVARPRLRRSQIAQLAPADLTHAGFHIVSALLDVDDEWLGTAAGQGSADQPQAVRIELRHARRMDRHANTTCLELARQGYLDYLQEPIYQMITMDVKTITSFMMRTGRPRLTRRDIASLHAQDFTRCALAISREAMKLTDAEAF